ncbi:MAG: hypothetical protein KatS3mg129_0771 [Leptospiraceae bacterium]|nr:MAG: hypothetical protein KatS3mg129_0771 [Leptospiraceae bacterium]
MMNKKIYLFIILFFSSVYLLAQEINLNESDKVFEPAKIKQISLNGFSDTPWMTPFSQIKDKFKTLAATNLNNEKIEILHMERNKYILIKRNNIIYRYNFYKTPFEVIKIKNHDITYDQYDQTEAVLYQVRIILPFIEAKLLEEKLQNAYGKKTKSTVDPKTLRGADIWDLEGGYIFLWYEPYNNKAFARRIDFISKELSQKILEESKDYFDSKEKQLLRDLIVK